MKEKIKIILQMIIIFYKNIRIQCHLRIGYFNFETGWFHGSDLIIFNIKFFEIIMKDFVTIFSIQIFKFSISFYWSE